MDKKDHIEHLWHLAYDLMRGPGSDKRYLGSSYVHLTPKFDEEMLNEIASLKTKEGEDLTDSVIQLRTKLGLAHAMSLFAGSDLERMEVLLDKIGE